MDHEYDDTFLSNGVLEHQFNSLMNTGPLSWHQIIWQEFTSEQSRYAALDRELTTLYHLSTINPARENIFRAFRECPAENCRVVILGQDPYPRSEHAMGLSFSVPAGEPLPPTLKNILEELRTDIGPDARGCSGDLTPWAQNGVLLLNTVLSVEAGNSNSHQKLWGNFSENILMRFNQGNPETVVYILWGNPAGKIGMKLQASTPAGFPRKFLYSVHPSPLAAYRGFFGSKPFSQANDFLTAHGSTPIPW